MVAHNGTITNIWGLTNKYGVDAKNIHVDSLGLAVLLDKEGYKNIK